MFAGRGRALDPSSSQMHLQYNQATGQEQYDQLLFDPYYDVHLL